MKPGLVSPSVETKNSRFGSKPLEHGVSTIDGHRRVFFVAKERGVRGMIFPSPLPVVVELQHAFQIKPDRQQPRFEELCLANRQQAIMDVPTSDNVSLRASLILIPVP